MLLLPELSELGAEALDHRAVDDEAELVPGLGCLGPVVDVGAGDHGVTSVDDEELAVEGSIEPVGVRLDLDLDEAGVEARRAQGGLEVSLGVTEGLEDPVPIDDEADPDRGRGARGAAARLERLQPGHDGVGGLARGPVEGLDQDLLLGGFDHGRGAREDLGALDEELRLDPVAGLGQHQALAERCLC